ncbi:hypothetical protein AAJCM20276_27480 [Acetobacter aceti]|uniref:Uncharacterized protein n=1 Tax=Acetobacter aceti TaxID=435 RepID=A0A6S6PSP4_ACEAC|nr:hypothetical protein [Acetobacter aceti]BCI68124.1 hypothetical protein AAJCM20276_27480 [Acetobacter aceti]
MNEATYDRQSREVIALSNKVSDISDLTKKLEAARDGLLAYYDAHADFDLGGDTEDALNKAIDDLEKMEVSTQGRIDEIQPGLTAHEYATEGVAA